MRCVRCCEVLGPPKSPGSHEVSTIPGHLGQKACKIYFAQYHEYGNNFVLDKDIKMFSKDFVLSTYKHTIKSF